MRPMSELVVVGAGPIGSWVAEAAVEDGVVAKVAAVVDPDPEAREALQRETGAAGYESTVVLPPAKNAERALVAFSSRADKVGPEIIRLVSSGYHVVTTCEELAWAPRHIWDAMHTSARSNQRVIVVTGTNPGFIMDRVPLLVAQGSRRVRRIVVTRRVDSSTRRRTLVDKSGYGLTVEEFRRGLEEGRVGHKGLDASARLIARGLLWPYHDVAVRIEPIVEDGRVVGADHRAELSTGDGRSILLRLVMAWELDDPCDEIEVEGSPPIAVRFDGGYPGDEGTVANVLAGLRRCSELDPGFYRPTDLPLRFGVR
ncbi:MAG TPA: hypothetical protein ENK55_06170 [Actinobacteria bacterium]|nr:hypothetical protein [Actinomycetota bacterium]